MRTFSVIKHIELISCILIVSVKVSYRPQLVIVGHQRASQESRLSQTEGVQYLYNRHVQHIKVFHHIAMRLLYRVV
mgnify:FL=1